jgi:hypothetical protein
MSEVTYRKAAQRALERMPQKRRELIQSKIEDYARDPDLRRIMF